MRADVDKVIDNRRQQRQIQTKANNRNHRIITFFTFCDINCIYYLFKMRFLLRIRTRLSRATTQFISRGSIWSESDGPMLVSFTILFHFRGDDKMGHSLESVLKQKHTHN